MTELLERMGWTQAELGRQLGVSGNTVSRWCKTGGGLSYRLACLYLQVLLRMMGK